MNNLTQVLTKGLQSDLDNTAVENGLLRFTTDTGRLYLDVNDERLPISNVVIGLTEAQIKALSNPPEKLYAASDTFRVFVSNGTSVYDVSRIIPVVTSANETNYVWMGQANSTAPKYSTNFSYNPSTKEVTAGNLKVNKTEENDGTKVLNFYLV